MHGAGGAVIVNRTFHLVTGEFPPRSGGVGDYTRLLALGLAAHGCVVHVWCPGVDEHQEDGVRLHRLPDAFGRRARRTLHAALLAAPGCLLLQYVPNALGWRGANIAFCLWLMRAGRTTDVRVMFHEPYFYFGRQSLARNALAAVQRVMAAALLRAASTAYLPTDAWRRYLEAWAPEDLVVRVIPVPATLPGDVPGGLVERWRRRLREDPTAAVIGHFGTFGDHVAEELRNVLPHVLALPCRVRVALIGRRSDSFAASLPELVRKRIVATGELSALDAAAALHACDLLVQPYPDGVTTRRTSVMAGLAAGVAVVTTDGELSEAVWRATGAAALVPCGDPEAVAKVVTHLLQHPQERLEQAARGRRVYDAEFAMDHSIVALIEELRASA